VRLRDADDDDDDYEEEEPRVEEPLLPPAQKPVYWFDIVLL
jgi:hypothetical protein